MTAHPWRLVVAAFVAALTVGAPATDADTFNLQAYIFCDVGSWCGYADEDALRDNYYFQVGLMNLQYRTADISYRALPPIILQDNRYAGMTGPREEFSATGELNAVLQNELITLFGAPNPGRITLFLAPRLEMCWNGIPCPGEDDGFDGDDVVFCFPPAGELGLTYAHEMGHFWCLRHTFTFQDPADSNPVDRNGDDNVNPACSTLINVSDTPDDPGVREGSDFSSGVPVASHEWCETTTFTGVDPGSARDSYCTVDCYLNVAGVGTVPTGYAPFTENAMSYYSPENCRGPSTINGNTSQPFTTGQMAQFDECLQAVPVRTQLQEVCWFYGGDSDHDGWCNAHDACPTIANTLIVDSDLDGVPDECDLCPANPDPSNTDTDNDGVGDACDNDDDNDGCDDGDDQHPLEASVQIGTKININCPTATSPWYGFEGDNTDGDALLNCEDPDDDNDGIPDAVDPCPNHADQICVIPGEACPLNPIWDICTLGGCRGLFLRLESVINPDPTTTLFFDHFQIVGDQVVIAPLAGRTLGETAMALTGQMPLAGGALPQGALQLDVMQYNSETDRQSVVSTLAVFDPTTANMGNILNGRQLNVKLPTETTDLTIAASWSAGDAPGGLPQDGDSDRVPDFADRCLTVANPDQKDADGDGFGDKCDADVDQDGMVTDSDIAAFAACAGIVLNTDYIHPHCGAEGASEGPPTPPDLASAIRQGQCRAMDLNGDGTVNAADIDTANTQLGLPPGPSGIAISPQALFSDGFESGGAVRWSNVEP